MRSKLTKYPALMLLIAVYAISTAVVVGNYIRSKSGKTESGERIVLRIAHWQLEPGIRNALDWCADKFEKVYEAENPDHDIEILQILIPEEGYFRWVNTQLIGRKAPDMIETGMGGGQQLWQKFYARYFIPLDRYVDDPNPFNEGTRFEDTPWRQTYFDEMEGGFEETLQSYFRVPLSAFTMRLYYNAEMVRAAWSSADGREFPTSYAGFAELCRRLIEYKKSEAARNREEYKFVPLAGTGYGFDRLMTIFQIAFTAPYLDRTDTNYDGTVSQLESAGPLFSGKILLTEPGLRANFKLLKEIAAFSPPGSASMDRDQANFQFFQGNAAMIPTGSWDYSTMVEMAEFDIAVADFPLPGKDHPEYGPYVAGQPSEADTRGGFPFAITKNSRHPEIALQFLQFASSARINEQLNRRMMWLPAIQGAEPAEGLEPFMPRVEGFSLGLHYVGPDTQLPYDQQLGLYIQAPPEDEEAAFEEFVRDYMEAYRRRLPNGVEDLLGDLAETLDAQMRRAAVRRAAIGGAKGAGAILTGDPEAQYSRILEAFVTQTNSRYHETEIWASHSSKATSTTD